MNIEKGFKQFLAKTGIFIALFIGFSYVIGTRLYANDLLSGWGIGIYGRIGYIVLFSLAGFVLLYRERLMSLEYVKLKVRDFIITGLSFTLLALFYIFEKNAYMFSISAGNIILAHFLLLSTMIFLVLGIYGFSFIVKFVKSFKNELSYFAGFGVVAALLMNVAWSSWPFFSKIVSEVVYFLLNILSNNVQFIEPRTLIINEFGAEIAEACSGIYSIFLFSAFYLLIIFLDWGKINKKKAILLFVPAVLGAFSVNILRVFMIMVLGAYTSEELALGLYHSYSGMIFFLIYFAIFWLLLYNWMKKPEFKSKEDSFLTQKYKKIMSDSLYRNSVYLMLSTLIMSLLGFIFWMIGARLFTTEQVGLATTLISVTGLISSFSLLGLNTGLIRYLPKSKDKNKKINTSFTLTAIVTIILSSLFLLSTNMLSPKLMFVHDNIFLAFVFIFFMIFASLSSLIDGVFMAYRSTKYILIKNTIFSSLKILLLFVFAWLGAYGIFTSHMIGLIAGFITVFIFLIFKFKYRSRFVFHDSIVKQIGKYSFGNYVAGFIGSLPTLLLPLLILNLLGAESSAYYFIAMMIATLLYAISSATSSSLFAEGSYDETQIKNQVKKAIRIIGAFLIPGILITLYLGKHILLLFGHDYSSEGFAFLKILALSGIFISINSIYSTLLRVRKKIKALILISIINALLILTFSYIFISRGMGLTGVGYAWIAGQAIISIIYLFFVRIIKPQRLMRRQSE